MKNLTFACALLVGATNALNLAANNQPVININITGMDDDCDDGDGIEININMDDSDQDGVDINLESGADDDDFDTPFTSYSHQLAHAEDIYDNAIQGGYVNTDPYNENLEGFNIGFGPGGVTAGIDFSDLFSSNPYGNENLEGFNFGIGPGGVSAGIDFSDLFSSQQQYPGQNPYNDENLEGFNFGIGPGGVSAGIDFSDLFSAQQQYPGQNPYNDENLEGFNFGIGPGGVSAGIDFSDLFSSDPSLMSSDGFNGQVDYPTLEVGIGFGIGFDGGFNINLMSGEEATSNCWMKSYGRGVGQVITDCPADKEKQLALCYPRCQAGYTGVGPVCWQSCPSGYRDDGAFCAKPAPYGRGVGRIGSKSGWERWGLLYYPKCREGFHNVGCCICSPDCQNDQTDIGVSCAKKSYGRTAGTPLQCAPGLEMSGALCYPPCQNGTTGIGPVCWGYCPTGMKQCGALCMAPDNECHEYVANVTKDVLSIAGRAAGDDYDINTAVEDASGTIDNFSFPVCNSYH